MRILLTCYLIALTATTLLISEGRVAAFQETGPPSQNGFVVGKWTLTRANSANDGRQIEFNAGLEGTYRTSQGKQIPIKNARYKKNEYLYFNVPDLQLYFEMRKVGDHFEGKMTVFSATEKKTPEPVLMTKNK
jgi:hypothetical protein